MGGQCQGAAWAEHPRQSAVAVVDVVGGGHLPCLAFRVREREREIGMQLGQNLKLGQNLDTRAAIPIKAHRNPCTRNPTMI